MNIIQYIKDVGYDFIHPGQAPTIYNVIPTYNWDPLFSKVTHAAPHDARATFTWMFSAYSDDGKYCDFYSFPTEADAVDAIRAMYGYYGGSRMWDRCSSPVRVSLT